MGDGEAGVSTGVAAGSLAFSREQDEHEVPTPRRSPSAANRVRSFILFDCAS